MGATQGRGAEATASHTAPVVEAVGVAVLVAVACSGLQVSSVLSPLTPTRSALATHTDPLRSSHSHRPAPL
jgi:hypothetical protein